ncbi:FMN-dependent NADH-azoreductase [Leeia aquatica]|uniref:FMN dependent NADH:quinone oxidoreductase n=1 Tax=Leeia aquatica TaxID=2725557 RepID=A0A847RYS0_9NEIS|nr:NAD(P)H-dependent oxidoreductase [Leeia aquatica]NLR76290.1 FMN-dependent NADH-azoreductase [Leeia aquatica]
MNILHLDSSPLMTHSVSRQLTAKLVSQLQQQNPDATLTYRDLAQNAPSHLSYSELGAAQQDPSEWSQTLRQDVETAKAILAEFLAADAIVVGAPMYNFSIPSQLKAWIDRISVAGTTFKYTETGPVGLLSGKTVYIVSSRGGLYGSANAMDHQEAYLKTVFQFLGLSDVQIIRAEGVNMGDSMRQQALQAAQQDIAAVAA